VAIAVLEQLARPVARFRFSAEILRPPHPFVAPCITRGRQAIFVRNLISHAFPYLFESAPVPHLAECRKFCPELTLDDLSSYPAGVRAQAVLRDGTLVHDFAIRWTKRTLHVCNAPSPAATSAIPIAAYLVDQMSQAFEVGEVRRQSPLPSSSNAVSGEVKIEPVVSAANLTARPSDRVRQTP
jgi:hypothetical protein